MDLNALPDDAEEEEVEVVEEEEEEEDEVEAAGDGELDAEEEDADCGDGEVEVQQEDQQEEEHDQQQEQQDRHETAVEILRREREERRAVMKRKQELDRAKNPSKTARTVAASTAESVTLDQQQAEDREKARALASLPEGWLNCPSSGEPIGRFIPSKVPLGEYFNGAIEPGKRYSWKHVLRHQRAARREVVLVIDLTFTTRYYSANEVEKTGGVKHIKIACRGRNEVPDNESVNRFVYEARRYLSKKENTYILVHCTHGFNRTGYMIANYLIRAQGYTAEQAVKEFAAVRPPGIYKRDYIENLYAFYHERKPQAIVVPTVPEWKRPLDLNGEAREDDDDDDDDGVEAPLDAPKVNAPMTIDDVLGDAIPQELQLELQRSCYQMLGVRGHGFPGSQPVSLDRKHLQLLRQKYYYATWKADGTRYMMLITLDGCYLIDRRFAFRRVQMRFPQQNLTENQRFTLLDGEMVIDKDPNTGVQNRRYLVYDLLILDGKSCIMNPFAKRWLQIESDVIDIRRKDARHNRRYDYDNEPFRVRRKDFWLLSTTRKLLHGFIPQLSHESDGLIFQGWDDPYVCRTHHGLLKWKYAHMNSVDFLLKHSPEKNKYCLHLADRGKHRELDRASVIFPEGVDPAAFEGKVIECSWKPDEQVWEFMRVRTDKELANAFATYEKVMGSISDNITEDVLFKEIDEILLLPMYKERIQKDQREQQKQKQREQHRR